MNSLMKLPAVPLYSGTGYSGEDEKKHRGQVFILDNLLSRPARRTGKRHVRAERALCLLTILLCCNGTSPKRTQKKSSLVLGNYKAISARTSPLIPKVEDPPSVWRTPVKKH